MIPRVLRGVRRLPRALAWSFEVHIRVLATAFLIDRVYLSGLLLLLLTPYVILYGAYGRVRPSARARKSSPFIYTMQ